MSCVVEEAGYYCVLGENRCTLRNRHHDTSLETTRHSVDVVVSRSLLDAHFKYSPLEAASETG